MQKNGKKIIGRAPDLPEEIENQLAEHVIEMEARFCGLQLKDLRKLAFQIADANDIPTRFNKKNLPERNGWPIF